MSPAACPLLSGRARLLAAIACAALGATCRADESALHLPVYGAARLPAPHAVAPPASAPAGEPPQAHARPPDGGSRFALIELAPDRNPLERNKRPHHALGYRWHAAEAWIREQGLDVQTCYLPLLRLHTKIRSDGASGTFWILGRCSFK
jgi:hypothetical protein